MDNAPNLILGSDVARIEEACRVVADTHSYLVKYVVPGASTMELDAIAEEFIRTRGGEPAFKGYVVGALSYPFSLCMSIDEEVVHGMPGKRVLKDGQILTIDLGVKKRGFYGDAAVTHAVGTISPEKQRLVDVTRQSLYQGISQAVEGNRVYDVSRAVQTCVEDAGFSVVRELVGHGIGKKLHEEPPVPNFVPGLLHRSRFPNTRLKAGQALAIEPMVNMGSFRVHTAGDGWTVFAADGKPSAHFEHTVLIDGNTPRILTSMD